MNDIKAKKRRKLLIIAGTVLAAAVLIAVWTAVTVLQTKRGDFKMSKEAGIAYDAFMAEYYVADETGGSIKGEDFWQTAEIFEVMVDAFERTGDKKYEKQMEEMFKGFLAAQMTDWSWNAFNDDLMWMVIGCSRAYLLTGNEIYKEPAIKHFNVVFDRAWSEELGGGLFWRTENLTKNSCINGPAVIAACLLGEITEDNAYYDKAKQIYEWQRANLFDEATGNVYDAYEISGNINKWASTYNQGTFIGAAAKLYEFTKDSKYMDDAKLAADYTVNVMFAGGIMANETDGNDLPGFKGILARWLYRFTQICEQPQYDEWMMKSAEAAWENRNSKDLMWTKWDEKTADDEQRRAWGYSAGVSMLFNSPD